MTQTTDRFIPSTYQKKILSWLDKHPNKHLMINAVAGSGKSTTLKQIAISLHNRGIAPKDIKIIVFGKQNSLDLKDKFGSHWRNSIHTLHSVGYQILFNNIGKITKVSGHKYRSIGRKLGYLGTKINPGSLVKDGCIESETQFLNLYNFLRLSLKPFNFDSCKEIIAYYGLDKIKDIIPCLIAMIEIDEAGIELALLQGDIDYIDMLYIPIVKKKIGNVPIDFKINPTRFVLVDECQDLNPLQKELSIKLIGDDGQLIFVGDPRQSIFGFAGATVSSFEEIRKQTSATVLPLSACYRCPKNHINLINKLYPAIPLRSTALAIDGIIKYTTADNIYHKNDDLVLCRKTAPLVEYCLKLISQGLPAKIKGKDVGKNLIAEVNRIDTYARAAIKDKYKFNHFLTHVEAYQEFKAKQWEDLDYGDKLLTLLEDKLACIKTVFNNLNEDVTLDALKAAIRKLFTESNHFISLSTIHRAKGLESDRVFILKYDSMPLTWENQQQWELEQEHNLIYVALTRSKSELYLIVEDPHLLR